MLFGEYLKSKRGEKGLSLRKYCLLSGQDPGTVSKIERGIIAPPLQEEKLLNLLSPLGVEMDTSEWDSVKELANISQGRIPKKIMDDEELVKRLPVFFRAIRDKSFTEEELREFIEKIRDA